MQLITTHTHSTYCAHALDSLEDMVKAAIAADISIMGITEHYPLTIDVDPREYVSMPKERLADYLAEIEALRQKYPQIELITGCELDWLGDDEDRAFAPDEFEPYDIILGSVHFVDLWPFDDPAQADHWKDAGVDAIWRRYFEVYCQAATSDMPFTTMSHPDLVKKFGYRPNFDPISLYRDAAEATREGGRGFELNTSGAYYDCAEVFPCPDLLREFFRAEVPVTVGTDAHEVANIDRDITKAYKMLYDVGYREITIPSRHGEWRTIPIE